MTAQSRSTATRCRGVALAAAVGVLTLGVVTSASAAGPSHASSTASAGTKVVKGHKTCEILAKPAKPAEPRVSSKPTAGEAAATATVVGNKRECPFLAIPAKPGELIKCKVVMVEGTPSDVRIIPHGPAKPGKPGKGCVILLPKKK